MNDRRKNTGIALAAAILSTSFLQTMASSATSPVLSMIKAEFSEAAMATVQLAMTLPSVFIMAVSLFITSLLKWFPLKTITLSGIFLYLAGGIGGVFVRSLPELLVLRSVMGIGLGLFCPMLSILISENFEGQQRTNMMGYLQSFNFLGGMAGTAIGGMLAAFGWRNAFWVYLFGVPAFIMSAVYIKNTGKQGQEKKAQAASARAAVPMASWFLGTVMMLHGILLFKLPLSASTLFAGLGVNDPGRSGMAVAVLYGGSFLAGLCMGTIRKILKRAAFPCACLLLGLAFFLLAMCTSEGYIWIGAFMLGFGSGVFAPMLYALAPEMIPPQAIPATMTILNAALYLGMFLSPYASVAIRSVGADTPAFDFFTAVGCELVFAVIAAWLMFRKPSERIS